jgi:glycosyltransferase involved in cell wall biosynthesis
MKKSRKILLVTSFNLKWEIGWYCKTGFEKIGHVVAPFDPKGTAHPVEEFFELLNNFRPDILIHTKDGLPAEVLAEAKKYTKLVMWYPDSVVPGYIGRYVSQCDLFFTAHEGLLEVFKGMNPKTFCLACAFEPSYFEIGEITKADREKFETDVTFVGSLGSSPHYLGRREYLKRVISEGFRLKWWGPRLPRKFSTIPLILGPLGRAYGGSLTGGGFIGGRDFALAARLSKIFLSFDAFPGLRKSMSDRLYTAVGCGAFFLCLRVDGIEEVFTPGREITVFDSEQEMIDMIKYYLSHDTERREIAENGRGRVLAEYTYEIRLKRMMEIIDRELYN